MNLKLLRILPLFLLIACSGKKSVQTQFSVIQLGANLSASASTIPGGMILTGVSGSMQFSAGIPAQQVGSFSLELPYGTWEFTAIAWLDNMPMSGASRCAVASATIDGQNNRVSMNLNTESCSHPAIAASSSFKYSNPDEFKRLTLNSCLNPVGKAPSDLCNGSDRINLSNLPGESLSVRVRALGGSNFGASPPSLTSACYNIYPNPTNTLKTGEIETTLTIPHGGLRSFPLEIQSFEKGNCAANSFVTSYRYPDGTNGVQGAHRQLFIQPSEDYDLLNFTDNFIGVMGSPFLLAHLDNTLKLPIPHCDDNCFNTSNYQTNYGLFTGIRDAMWSMFGSPDQRNAYDFEEILTPGSLTLTNNNGGFFSLDAAGTAPIQINFFPGASLNIGCFPGMNEVNIYYEEDITTSSEIVSELDSSIDCITMFLGYSSGGANPGIWPSSYVLGPAYTQGPYTVNRRQDGNFHNISSSLIGAFGAILHKNGITDPAVLCSQSGTFQETLFGGESVSLTLKTPSASADLPFFTGSTTTGQFQRKLELRFMGVLEEAIYFNCGGDGRGMGAYVQRETNNQRSVARQAFWDVTSTTDQWFEQVAFEYDSSSSQERRRYSLYQSIDATESHLWLMNHDSFHGSTKLAAKINGGAVNIHGFNTIDDISEDFIDLTNTPYDQQWGIPNADLINGSATQLVPEPSLSVPNLLPDYSNESFYNVPISGIGHVWPLNY